MPRVLLAWEGGAGRGHVVTLTSVATALGAPEHIDAALYRMDHAAEIAPHCALAFRGPGLAYDPAKRSAMGVPTSTWAEFLGDLGFLDEAFLTRQIGWWRETILARRCGLVVGDYAPCALLAARSLRVRAVGVGTGYGLPSPDLETFPVLIPEYSAKLHDEAEMLAVVNRALAHFGAGPLARLAQIYAYDDQLVRSLPLLDPYAELRRAPYLAPVAFAPARILGGGDEIFAYFSTTELENSALVEALLTLGAPLRLFAPGAPKETLDRLATAGGVTIETRPAPEEEIARRSRMIVHSAQHGISCLALASGLPQFAFPQHLEHEYHARKAEALGTLRRAPRETADACVLRESLLDVYESRTLRDRALAIAETVRPQFAVDNRAAIRARLDAVMADASN